MTGTAIRWYEHGLELTSGQCIDESATHDDSTGPSDKPRRGFTRPRVPWTMPGAGSFTQALASFSPPVS